MMTNVHELERVEIKSNAPRCSIWEVKRVEALKVFGMTPAPVCHLAFQFLLEVTCTGLESERDRETYYIHLI